MAALDGVYLKLDRARFHACELKQRIQLALHPDLYEFVREVEGDPPRGYLYRINRLPYIDPEWSLVLGDFLTNLRAALDHLAWQLALRELRKPSDSTQFPIRDSDRDTHGSPRPARICNLTDPRVLAAVEAVQPYNGAASRPGGVQNNGLCILNNLVNIDKHRLLLVIAVGLSLNESYWFVDEGAPPITLRINPRPLEDGDEVARFDFGGAEPTPDFDPRLGLQVRLNDGPAIPAVRGIDLLSLVNRLYFEIEHTVIGMHFAPIFGVPARHWISTFGDCPKARV